jgi:hypothetical protein
MTGYIILLSILRNNHCVDDTYYTPEGIFAKLECIIIECATESRLTEHRITEQRKTEWQITQKKE